MNRKGKVMFHYNTEVIKKAEYKDGWLVLTFKKPHPIKSKKGIK